VSKPVMLDEASELSDSTRTSQNQQIERRPLMAGIAATRRPNRLPSLWRDPFTALQEEMSQLRTRLFGDGDEGWFTGTIVPELDMSETETAIEVRMDVPGVTAKDIDIQINGNVLTVSGERKEEKEEKGKTFHRIERRYGNFLRSVTLPCTVAESEVAAEYHDGVLTVKLPKTEESKPHKVKVKG
jgi:HSP20 family protein